MYRADQNLALNCTPQVRGSLTKPVRLLKSMPPTMRLLVEDVAAEQRDLAVIAVPVVADAQAALDHRLADELDRVVQEEIDLAAVGPVGVDEELAAVRPARQ